MGIDDIIAERQAQMQRESQQSQRQDQPSSIDTSGESSSFGGIDIERLTTIGGLDLSVEELLIVLLAADIVLTLVVVSQLSRQVVR